jgi:tRNA(Leu) C34 or U34 (ribose-2'-O)-methylase TrmL
MTITTRTRKKFQQMRMAENIIVIFVDNSKTIDLVISYENEFVLLLPIMNQHSVGLSVAAVVLVVLIVRHFLGHTMNANGTIQFITQLLSPPLLPPLSSPF